MPTGMVTRLLQIRHARDVRRRRLREEESTPKRGGKQIQRLAAPRTTIRISGRHRRIAEDILHPSRLVRTLADIP